MLRSSPQPASGGARQIPGAGRELVLPARAAAAGAWGRTRQRLPSRAPARTTAALSGSGVGRSMQQSGAAGGASVRGRDAPLVKDFGFRTNFAETYELGPMLGSGSFATVHLAIHRQTGEKFAVKTMPKRFLGEHLEPMFAARIRHETDVYRTMGQSLNVAHLEAAFEDDVAVDLVLELCGGGTMWGRIKRGAYSERSAARMVREVLRGVAQCHAKGVILRDVKPDNFLFLNDREDAPLKMVDFGLAQFCQPGEVLTDRAGTPFFVAPEVLKQSYGLPADVWSAGITAYQLLTGRFPWHDDPEVAEARAQGEEEDALRTGRPNAGQTHMSNKLLFRAILFSEFDYSWDPWPALSKEAKEFVQAALTRDPKNRPTAVQLLRHPWLAGLAEEDAAAAAAATAEEGGAGAAGDAPLSDSLVQRLQRFGTYGRLKQIALREVAHLMLQDGATLQSLADAFARLDPGGTGRVPYARAVEELRDGSYDLSASEIRTLLQQFDLDRDGTIDLDEWVAALTDWGAVEQRQEWESWVQQVFDLFDRDHSSRISTTELAQVLCGAPGSSDEELCIPDAVPAALRRVDSDGDGHVSFSEFVDYLHTSEADTLELFPARRLRKGGKRTAWSVVEERRARAAPPAAGA